MTSDPRDWERVLNTRLASRACTVLSSLTINHRQPRIGNYVPECRDQVNTVKPANDGHMTVTFYFSLSLGMYK
jgi:hypothetical protein